MVITCRIVSIILLLSCWGFPAVSQELGREIVRFTTEQGLSQGFVTCLAQDRTGYIWVGTMNGLNRFDGYSFKSYKHDELNPASIYSDAIQSLTVDEKGYLWVFSGSGIQVYDSERDEFKGFKELEGYQHLKFESVSYLKNNQLIFVVDGKVWSYEVQYEEGGNLSLKYISAVSFDLGKMGAIYSMVLRNAVMWIASETGIFSLSQSGHLERVIPEIKEAVFEIWQDEVHRKLLIQTTKGVYVLDDQGGLRFFKGIGVNYGTSLSGKKIGKEYLLFGGNQVWRWTGDELEQTSMKFEVNITAALIDRRDNIWMGLDAVGLACIQNKKKVINKIIAEGKPAFNRTVMDRNGDLWAFTKLKKSENAVADLGFYSIYDSQKKAPSPFGNRIYGYQMDIDEQGVKWLVDEQQQLIKIDPNGKRMVVLIDNINHFNILFGVNCLRGQEKLLVSNNCREACFIRGNGQKIFVNNLDRLTGGSLEGFSSVHKPSDVSPWVWIASPSQVFGIKPEWETGGVAFRALSNHKLPTKIHHHHRIIFANPDLFDPDVVWIGTWEGLFKWNLKTDQVQEVTSKNGPLKCVTFTMAQSAVNILWIGTHDGLLRLNTASGESRLFTSADGLPATEFNRNTTTQGADGKIIMGTVDGYISFYPDELSGREVPEQMVISGVWQGSTSLPILQSGVTASIADLAYGGNNIMVQFSMLDYAHMQVPQYRFRYSHAGEEWYYNGLKNTVSLAGLLPGRYVFEVQGSLDGSLWSESAILVFTVGKPWWAAWWVLTLLALLVLSITYIIVRNRRQLLKEKYQNELLRREAEHEAEIIAAKERILTNVAHDLRTPITLITGMASRIPEERDEKVKRSVEIIRKQSSDLLSMINQILDLGRIREFGSLPLKPKVINLDQFLKNLLTAYVYQAELKTIQLDYDAKGELLLVFLDENALRAIIGNLLSNALKMTPTQGRVVLRAWVEGAILNISVQDTGPGVPPEEVARIFNRYYQSDAQSKVGGVGIGLAYASEMAELLGGVLKCEKKSSNEGEKGALFTLEFLVDKVIAHKEVVPGMERLGFKREEDEVENSLSNRPTVLLVEDNEEMASYIREFLEPTFHVIVTYDGAKGMEKAISIIPDVIITDVMMPGISGLELCQSLKADLRTSHIPVIMLTAKTGDEAIRNGLVSGASIYLTKPFDSDTLLQYVANCLQLREQTRVFFESRWRNSENRDTDEAAFIQPSSLVVDQESAFINKIYSILEQHYADDQYTVEDLATSLNLTPGQLRRKVAALGGGSVVNLIRSFRLDKSKVLLRVHQDMSIAEIAFACGFGDPNYFSSVFSKTYGISPTNYRKQP